MTKICYIIGQLGRAGAEKQLYELAKGIDRSKFLPVIISLSQVGYWAEEIRKLDIQVIEIPRRKSKEVARLFRLIKLLRAIEPHIVHTYLFPGNTYGRIAAIITRVPIIIASERNLPEVGKDKKLYEIYIDKLLAVFSDAIICNSYKASECLVKKYRYPAKKILTVYNGINITAPLTGDRFLSEEKMLPKIVGTVGRLYPQKNHKLFLDVAKAVLENAENKNIRFLVVGEGPLRSELENYSKKLGIGNRVVFTGEREDVAELLQTMNVFVMTSLYEGLANTIMEAMLAGLPVVATDVGGNGEMIIDKETGFLCPSNDAKSLAEKVTLLLNNDEEAVRMGKRGRVRIEREFGVERMVRATEEIYSNLTSRLCSDASR